MEPRKLNIYEVNEFPFKVYDSDLLVRSLSHFNKLNKESGAYLLDLCK